MVSEIEQCGLSEQVEQTREQILSVLTEVDDITLQQNPRITADYLVKIGVWEKELLCEQIAARRAKRKYEHIQAAINRGDSISDNSVDTLLDEEFAQWKTVIEAKTAAYTQALQRRVGSEPMTAKDSAEFKRLYRVVSKRLHPDLCVFDTEEASQLFMLAQRAYELGDIETLKSIEVSTRKYGQKDDTATMSQDELTAELALLESRLALLQEKLSALKASEPYCLAEKLADDMWVYKKVAALREQIEQAQKVSWQYAKRIEGLRKAS